MPERRTPERIPSLSALHVWAAQHPDHPVWAGVESYFARYKRPKRGAKILAAVSGGPDSMALLAILSMSAQRHRWQIGVAHVNYRLRGAESDGDERLVRHLARQWGLECHYRRPRRPKKQTSLNVQSWARAERYQFFEEIAASHGYDWIATGHQLDDRAETVVAAVLDAGGTFALAGIPPIRDRIIRPLFDCPKEAILDFLRRAAIPYRCDSSNRKPTYQRNRVRLRVLPQLGRHNPSIREGLARLGEQLWRQTEYLRQCAHDVLHRAIVDEDNGRLVLATGPMRRYDMALDPFVLRELICRIGLDVVPRPSTVARFTDLRRAIRIKGSVTVEQGALIMTRSKGEIEVRRRGCGKGKPAARIATLAHIITDVIAPDSMPVNNDRVLAHFDLASVAGGLVVRYPQPGDRYRPFGLNGTKKLADLFADRAVPAFERQSIPVVTDQAGILWPVGHPIADRARVTKSTRHVLQVRVAPV